MSNIKSHGEKTISEKHLFEAPLNSKAFSANHFRAFMRHIPATVSIVAAGPEGKRNGLTCTSVCSLSLAPPTLLVCVNHSATAHDEIIQQGFFSINFLAKEQEAVARTFSGTTGDLGEERFKTGNWTVGKTGAPLLSQSLSSAECRISDHKKTTTHTIFFGEIVSGSADRNKSPLIYVQGSYSSLNSDVTRAGEAE